MPGETLDIPNEALLFRATLDEHYDHDIGVIRPEGMPFHMVRDATEPAEESCDWERFCKTPLECRGKREADKRNRYGVVQFVAGKLRADDALRVLHTPDKGLGGKWDDAHASMCLPMKSPKTNENSLFWKQARTVARQRLNDAHLVVLPIPLKSAAKTKQKQL